MTTLPLDTDEKIKKLMKQYGRSKWEIIVMAIDEEYAKLLIVKQLLKKASEPKGK